MGHWARIGMLAPCRRCVFDGQCFSGEWVGYAIYGLIIGVVYVAGLPLGRLLGSECECTTLCACEGGGKVEWSRLNWNQRDTQYVPPSSPLPTLRWAMNQPCFCCCIIAARSCLGRLTTLTFSLEAWQPWLCPLDSDVSLMHGPTRSSAGHLWVPVPGLWGVCVVVGGGRAGAKAATGRPSGSDRRRVSTAGALRTS